MSARQPKVAVIGMSGRFPGAPDLATFWHNLRHGVESIRPLVDEELEISVFNDPADVESLNYVKAAGVIEDIDLFDAAFFGVNPREAEIMDPQHRLFLECAWQAFEDAGYDPGQVGEGVGVFTGAAINSYMLNNLNRNIELMHSMSTVQLITANDRDYLPTRVSFKLGLGGPSFNVQSACSTSLVASHLACESLRHGHCDMALAGGVTLRVPQHEGYLWMEGSIASPDGHCRAFDREAGGTIFTGGLGAVLFKRLDDALRDGDHVRAVVLGSAVNNDGKDKVGYTAPGLPGQVRVLEEALQVSGVDPRSIGYVEAHGTATALGDPTEVGALTRAFRAYTQDQGFCHLGSVKTNIGHADTAAGVAGLIKAVMTLENEEIPPNLHFESPNPALELETSPFRVAADLVPWPRGRRPRRATVSSFGIGGTNANLVLEEAPAVRGEPSRRTWHLLPLAARTSLAVERAAHALSKHLRADVALELGDVAYTLQNGRRAFEQRTWAVAQTPEEAVRELARPAPVSAAAEGREVVFLFPGQGAQYPGMAAGLYRDEPAFRDALDHGLEIADDLLDAPLRDLLLEDEGTDPEEAATLLAETRLTQPALFLVEHTVARAWARVGVRPSATLGHSIGEYVSACIGGSLELADALRLVVARGRLMQEAPTGAMAAVPLSAAEVAPLLEDGITVAVASGADRCVVAGPTDRVEAWMEARREEGLSCRRLATSHAFHSPMMESVLDRFRREVEGVPLAPPRVPWVSNVSGTWITDDQATSPAYWVEQLRSCVQLDDGLRTLLLARPAAAMVEVGPGGSLTSLVRRHADRGEGRLIHPGFKPGQQAGGGRHFLSALGSLWAAGVEVEWEGLYPDERRRRVPLPTYPFERRRFWVDPKPQGGAWVEVETVAHSERPPEPADWTWVPRWRQVPRPASARDVGGSWLLIGDGAGLADALAACLERDGHRVAVARFGEDFRRESEGAYRLRRRHQEDYQVLLEAVEEEAPLDRLVHLADVAPADEPGNGEDSFFGLFYLARALDGRRRQDTLRLAVVSSGAYRVTEGDRLRPRIATLLGPVRVMPQEVELLACRHLDVEPPEARGLERLAGEVLAEVLVEDEPVVALRGGTRWAEVMAPMPDAAAERFEVREGGTYLISGGLGGLGLESARLLAGCGQVRLALLGRSALPEPERRSAWVEEHGADDPVSRRIREVEALEALGSEVLVLQADVTDATSLTAAVDAARQRFGPIHGVIHSAGLAGRGMLQNKSPEEAAAVLAPKLEGSQNLAAAAAGDQLDFFVLYSSLISRLGGLGQVDYCAGNAFLDAYAQSLAADGMPAVAIGWDAWDEVGMAVREGALGEGAVAAEPGRGFPGTEIFAEADRRVFATVIEAADWFADEHRLGGSPSVPGTAYLDLAAAAWRAAGEGGGVRVEELVFVAPLILEPEGRVVVYTVLEAVGSGTALRILAEDGSGDWREHARGRLTDLSAPAPPKEDVATLLARCADEHIELEPGALAGSESDLVRWGPRWHSLHEIWTGDGEAVARLELDEGFTADLDDHPLHPALLDVATSFPIASLGGEAYLPLSYEGVSLRGPLPRRCYSHVRVAGKSGELARFEVRLLDEGGREVVAVDSFVMRRVDSLGPATESPFPAPPETAEGSDEVPYRLEIGSIGRFESLALRPVGRRRPAPGEVEIRVEAAGVNFKDVLVALGRIEAPLGQECAGTVTAVGESVGHLSPGDRVMALAGPSFGRWLTCDAHWVVPVPEGFDPEEVAGLPLVFVTAVHGLEEVARLRKGERVLIHAAAGGVGLAALQICQRFGAEIYASAGSEEKRQHLRSLGVSRLVDSRSLAFADQILDLTDGEGVDIVLNSLSGDFIAAGLSVLRPFGRFVEIGRRDILEGRSLDLSPFADNLSYAAIDIAQLVVQRPGYALELLESLHRRLAAGEFRPLPHRTFPLESAAEAFDHLAQARHVGKLVLKVPDGRPASLQQGVSPSAGRGRSLTAELGLGSPSATAWGSPEDGATPLSPEEGRRVLAHILFRSQHQPQVVVTKARLGDLLAEVRKMDRSRLLAQAGGAGGSAVKHERPDLSTPWVGARDQEEADLVEIWEDVLGVEGIGVDDDFFELGGDSVLGIQVVARATEAGFDLSPEQLFERATIAALAEGGRSAPQEAAALEVLSPVQLRSVAATGPRGAEWQALEVGPQLDTVVLERALGHLVERHGLLASQLDASGTTWRPVAAAAPLERIDLTEHAADGDGDRVEDWVSERASALDASSGPLLAGLLVDLGAAGRRLVLLLHRLAADVASWNLLLEELNRAYVQVVRGVPPRHPDPAVDYGRWLQQALPPALDDGERMRLERWREELPSAGEAARGRLAVHRLGLDHDRTRQLVDEVAPGFQMEIDEILLTALAQGTAIGPGAYVELLRDAHPDTPTVGRCETAWPLLLPPIDGDPVNALKQVKEAVRGLVGAAAGPLAALWVEGGAEAVAAVPPAPVVVRHRRHSRARPPADAMFSVVAAGGGGLPELLPDRGTCIETGLDEGELRLTWSTRGAAAADEAAEAFLDALRRLIDEAVSGEAEARTPSDFPEAGLSQDQLDRFLGGLRLEGEEAG